MPRAQILDSQGNPRRQPRASPAPAAGPQNQYACTKCQIRYFAAAAGCPVCQLQKTVADLQRSAQDVQLRLMESNRALMTARNQMELLTSENQKLKVEVDVVEAMREAAALLGVEDLTFVKSVLYRYRADKSSLSLKVTHATQEQKQGTGSDRRANDRGVARRGSGRPNGFIVEARNQNPEAHLCSSLGGVAVAVHFDIACRIGGSAYALAALLRAGAPLLSEAP